MGRNFISHKEHLYRHVYKFKAAKRLYLIHVDEHEHKTYIIKFFTQKSEKSKYKYNLLVGDYDASRIIATCVNVMLDILEKNELASFAFIGAETYEDGQSLEKGKISKRFSIYRKLMANKFGVINFTHIEVAEKNAYLMYNVKNKPDTDTKITEKIISYYPDLGSDN